MRANERQELINRLEPNNFPPDVRRLSVVPEQRNLREEEAKNSHMSLANAKTRAPVTIASKIIPEDSKVLPGDVKNSEPINEQRKAVEEDLPDTPKDVPEEGRPLPISTQSQLKLIVDTKVYKMPPKDIKSQVAPPNALSTAPALNVTTITPNTSQINPPVSTAICKSPGTGTQTSFTNQVGKNATTQTGESPSKAQNISSQTSSLATEPVVSRMTKIPPSAVQLLDASPQGSNVAPQSFNDPQGIADFPKTPSPIPSAVVDTRFNGQYSDIPLETSSVVPIQASNLMNKNDKEVQVDAKSMPLFRNAELDPSSQILLGYKDAISCTYLIFSLNGRLANQGNDI